MSWISNGATISRDQTRSVSRNNQQGHKRIKHVPRQKTVQSMHPLSPPFVSICLQLVICLSIICLLLSLVKQFVSICLRRQNHLSLVYFPLSAKLPKIFWRAPCRVKNRECDFLPCVPGTLFYFICMFFEFCFVYQRGGMEIQVCIRTCTIECM